MDVMPVMINWFWVQQPHSAHEYPPREPQPDPDFCSSTQISTVRGRPRGFLWVTMTPCSKISPPQTPQGSRRCRAPARHWGWIGQLRQRRFARCSWQGSSANHRSVSASWQGSKPLLGPGLGGFVPPRARTSRDRDGCHHGNWWRSAVGATVLDFRVNWSNRSYLKQIGEC